jgi:hypothetical protein
MCIKLLLQHQQLESTSYTKYLTVFNDHKLLSISFLMLQKKICNLKFLADKFNFGKTNYYLAFNVISNLKRDYEIGSINRL